MGCSWFEKELAVEDTSYSKYFEKACPIYMLYGLSYEDFWYGDPLKAKYQREMYNLKLQHKDEYMWEQGMYIYEAILQCAPILHPFSKAKNPLPYTHQPHLKEIQDMEDEAKREKLREAEQLKAQIWIRNWARGMQKKFKQE